MSDIAAMGGRPRAILDVLWAGDDPEQTRPVLEGLRAGSARFGVPIAGGHTGRIQGSPQLCAAIVGKARRLISGFVARPGQQVLACIDLDGAFRGQSANFDAFTTVAPRALRAKLDVLPQLAEAGVALAGKDISMAGLVGTLVMLLETSRCGAVLDLAAVPVPDCAAAEPRRWLEAFPSFGYLLAVEPRSVADVIARFEAVGVTARVIAELTSGSTLEASYGPERICHWDFASESLMGFGGTNA